MADNLHRRDLPKTWRIDIHLPALGELFNALDPSPLVGRDIDDRVEEYIVATASDAPSHAPQELAISAPRSEQWAHGWAALRLRARSCG